MKKGICVSSSLALIFAFTASLAWAQPVNSDQVVKRAEGAYYNLKRHGFAGFKATLIPNWEVTLGSSATPENLKVFRAIHFSIVVTADGAVTLTNEVAETDRARVAPYLKPIHDDVARLVSSTLGSWARFMVNSPFPENEKLIKIENTGDGYRFFFPTESADAMLAMTGELLTTELKLTARTGSRTIKPRFEKTAGGFLLSGYQSSFEPVGQGITTNLDIALEYQEVERLKLPQKIEIRGTHNGEPIEAELRFAEYVLNPARR